MGIPFANWSFVCNRGFEGGKQMSDRPSVKQRKRVHEIVDSILDLYHPKVKIVTKANKKIITIEADIND